MLKPSFSAGITGDGVTRSLACSCAGEAGTGELAVLFSVSVGASVISLVQPFLLVLDSVAITDVCPLPFTPDSGEKLLLSR